MLRTVGKALIFVLFSGLASCSNSSGTPWTDMKHLYDDEIAPTKSRVMALESELAKTQRELADLQKEVDDLRAEMNTARLPEPASPAPAAANLPPREPMAVPEEDYALNDAPAEATYYSDAAADVALAESDAEDGADTGAGGLFVLHLASYTSPGNAKAGWRQFSADYPAELGGLTPWITTIVKPETGETFHRLLAGPLTSALEAQELCGKLKAQDVYCKVMPFEGDPLIVQ